MKSFKFMAPVVLVFFSVLISCSKSTDYQPPATADTSTHKISILSAKFDPSTLTIVAGDKVTWINNDTTAHSIISDDANSFNSGTINPGGTFSVSFLITGSFAYHCGVHPEVRGVVYAVYK